MRINTRVGHETGYGKKALYPSQMEFQLTFIPLQIWVKARNTKHEITWSEYYTQHTVTDRLSFIAAIIMAALWHKCEY
jgi:hypothetical protein